MNSKLKHDREVSIPSLDRDLGSLNVELTNYLLLLQEDRKNNEGRGESRKKSQFKSKIMNNPSAVKSAVREEEEMLGIRSKIKDKKESNIKELMEGKSFYRSSDGNLEIS